MQKMLQIESRRNHIGSTIKVDGVHLSSMDDASKEAVVGLLVAKMDKEKVLRALLDMVPPSTVDEEHGIGKTVWVLP